MSSTSSLVSQGIRSIMNFQSKTFHLKINPNSPVANKLLTYKTVSHKFHSVSRSKQDITDSQETNFLVMKGFSFHESESKRCFSYILCHKKGFTVEIIQTIFMLKLELFKVFMTLNLHSFSGFKFSFSLQMTIREIETRVVYARIKYGQ